MAIPVIWIVASLTFALVRVVPGGPFDAEKNLPPQIVANIKAKYHLDRPLPEQYLLYMNRLIHGDLGVSYKYVSRTVNDILCDAFPVSLELGGLALSLAVLVGVPLGTIAAVRRGTGADWTAMFLSTMGVSLPSFLNGALLIFRFRLVVESVTCCALGELDQHDTSGGDTCCGTSCVFIALDQSERPRCSR